MFLDTTDLCPLPPFTFRDLVPNKVAGARPVLAWIDPKLLLVDRRYQRASESAASRKNIAKIVTAFDWARFKPCTVTPIGDNYLVIDGQHSAIAAMAHPDVTDIPCWIVEAKDLAEQARIFIGINADRVAVTPLQLHRSSVVAEDGMALRVKAVCDAAGVTMLANPRGQKDMQPGDTMSIGIITGIIKRDGDDVARQALTALHRSHPDKPNELPGALIAAVAAFIAGRAGVGLDRLTSALGKTSAGSMLAQARRLKFTDGIKIHDGLVSHIVRLYDGAVGSLAVPPARPQASPSRPRLPAEPMPAPAPRPALRPTLAAPAPVGARPRPAAPVPAARPNSRVAEEQLIHAAIEAGLMSREPSGDDLREIMKDVPAPDHQSCIAWAEKNSISVVRIGTRCKVNGKLINNSEVGPHIQMIARTRAVAAWRRRQSQGAA